MLSRKQITLIFVGIFVFILVHTRAGRELLLPAAEKERRQRQADNLKRWAARWIAGKNSCVLIRLVSGEWQEGYLHANTGDSLALVNRETAGQIIIDMAAIENIRGLRHAPVGPALLGLAAIIVGAVLLATLMFAWHIR